MACIIYSAILYVVWEFILVCPAGLPTSIVVSVTGAILYFIVCNATYKKDGERLDPDSLTEV